MVSLRTHCRHSLCLARTWNSGRGGQCMAHKFNSEGLCTRHAHKQSHGLVTGLIPQQKLREFLARRTIANT
eukprot:3211038-Amphidinium_carterae.1